MPLPQRSPGGLSPAVNDLGLGSLLEDQVAGETEEERKRRMREQQQAGLMPPGTSGTASPASLALFGGMGGLTR